MVGPTDWLDYCSEGAFAIAADLRILTWNGRAEQSLGFPASEALGRPCHQVIAGTSPEGRPICTAHCSIASCLARGQPFPQVHLIARTRDGRGIPLSLSTVLLSPQADPAEAVALVLFRPLGPPTKEPPPAFPRLWIRCLGPFELYREPEPVPHRGWKRQQALTLLKYLLTYRGHPVHREALMEALWPELPPLEGLGRVKVLVHSLRRSLEPGLTSGGASRFIGTEGECYLFRADAPAQIDVDQFEQHWQQGEAWLQRGHLLRALAEFEAAEALYRGDYLEQDPYADWCAEERERLKELYLTVLGRIATTYLSLGETEQAIGTYRKALAKDPCRESLHRALMLSLAQAGRRDEALRQYHLCREILGRELGVPPLPETTRLYHRLRGAKKMWLPAPA